MFVFVSLFSPYEKRHSQFEVQRYEFDYRNGLFSVQRFTNFVDDIPYLVIALLNEFI